MAPLAEEPPKAVPGVVCCSEGCRLCRFALPMGMAPEELIVVGAAPDEGASCCASGEVGGAITSLLCFTSCTCRGQAKLASAPLPGSNLRGAAERFMF